MRYPDFTIGKSGPGELYCWEHCEALEVPEYRRRWDKKKKWYRDQGILPVEEGGGENGTLIITEEKPEGGVDLQEVSDLINRILN